MRRRFDTESAREEARARLMGLGERSARKSFYPALQSRLADLQRFRALLDESGEGILLVEWPSGLIADANESACRQLACERGQLLGSRLADHAAGDAPNALAEEAAQTTAGGPQRIVRVDLRRADGRTFPAEIGLRHVLSDGRAWLVAVARDITEREQIRARLSVAERMASVGTLAAGVAHEINNPLSNVIANLDFAQQEVAKARCLNGTTPDALSQLEAALRDASEGAERVHQIVRDLKSMSRADDERLAHVDLSQVVDSASTMVAHEVRQRARLVREYRAPARVLGNEGRLTQVLVNLLVNAAHAIPEGKVQHNEIRVVVGTEADRAVVEVRDTGGGIKPEHLGRIFDPFFTTKAVGQGTGLGLSICQRIISDLGGTIDATSEPGVGTAFRVCLPLAPAAPEEANEPPGEPTPAPRHDRLLVIDDDPSTCRATVRMLEPSYDVTTSSSARDALARLAGGDRYDAILCDLVMPDLDGQAFYEGLRASAPDQASRVVFYTGGAFTDRTDAFLRSTDAPVLEKPISPQALAAAVELVAARSTPRGG